MRAVSWPLSALPPFGVIAKGIFRSNVFASPVPSVSFERSIAYEPRPVASSVTGLSSTLTWLPGVASMRTVIAGGRAESVERSARTR